MRLKREFYAKILLRILKRQANINNKFKKIKEKEIRNYLRKEILKRLFNQEKKKLLIKRNIVMIKLR